MNHLRAYYTNATKPPWPFRPPPTPPTPQIRGRTVQSREACANVLDALCRLGGTGRSAALAESLGYQHIATIHKRLRLLADAGLVVKNGVHGRNDTTFSVTPRGRSALRRYRREAAP